MQEYYVCQKCNRYYFIENDEVVYTSPVVSARFRKCEECIKKEEEEARIKEENRKKMEAVRAAKKK